MTRFSVGVKSILDKLDLRYGNLYLATLMPYGTLVQLISLTYILRRRNSIQLHPEMSFGVHRHVFSQSL